jgi:hypothetical protein
MTIPPDAPMDGKKEKVEKPCGRNVAAIEGSRRASTLGDRSHEGVARTGSSSCLGIFRDRSSLVYTRRREGAAGFGLLPYRGFKHQTSRTEVDGRHTKRLANRVHIGHKRSGWNMLHIQIGLNY